MPPARRVLITGASGQDGHYLGSLLAARGDELLGVSRRGTAQGWGQQVALDIADHDALHALIQQFQPQQVYHLAAYHRSSATAVTLSEAEEEALYFRCNVMATRALLRSLLASVPHCRVFLAGSCHVFGNASESPQNEETAIRPNSIYGITKAMNLWLGRYYRETLGLYCSSGILYNHESELRGPSFVTGQIARAAAAIASGQAQELVLGNLEAQVDWGFAGDYAAAMALMLEPEVASDFVVASGVPHRVRDFVSVAFEHVGLDWRKYVRERQGVHRPVASALYVGDSSRLRALGWVPQRNFEDLVRAMVNAHLPASA